MNRFAFLLFAGIVFLASQGKAEDSLTGEDIARKSDQANRPLTGLVIKGEMELKNLQSGSSEKRKYAILSLNDQGSKKSIFRFLDSSYKNTTFLTLENPNGQKLQYVYLKSVGSARQVEASDRENSFVDTDIANEELGGSDLKDYTYKRLEDKTFDGMDCYVIERVPVRKNSKYQKHIVAIDKKTLIPVNVKTYSKDGRVVKTIKAGDVRKISDSVNLAFEITVTSVEKRHQTVIRILDAAEKNLSSSLFLKERISSAWSE
jgi:outer membrane lipoprotein-sorting protein